MPTWLAIVILLVCLTVLVGTGWMRGLSKALLWVIRIVLLLVVLAALFYLLSTLLLIGGIAAVIV